MFTKFATFGDIKALIQHSKGDDNLVEVQVFSSDAFARIKNKPDDEFFFNLSEDDIIRARLDRWPLKEHPDDIAVYGVCSATKGHIALLLTLNGLHHYFRRDGQWAYIGPGDPSNDLLREPRYEATKAIVDAYDVLESQGEETTHSALVGHIPQVHEIYLAEGNLGYHAYTHSDQAAYLLVTMFTFDDSNTAHPTLFLIAQDSWLYRREGVWHEIDCDEIVGPNGEFHGLLISSMLEFPAVEAWDSVDPPRDLPDAAVYCAAFPTFRLEACGYGQARLICDTENATWEANPEGWTLLRKGRPRSVAKQLSIESFTLDSWEHNGNVSPKGPCVNRPEQDEERFDAAVELGLLTLVNPVLVDEARRWLFGLPETDARSVLSYRGVNKFLLSLASPRIYVDGNHCTSLRIISGDVMWEHRNGIWSSSEIAEFEDSSVEQEFLTVDSSRLPELTAWWDSRPEGSRRIQDLPSNYNFIGAFECPGGFDLDCLFVEDSIRVIDGTRCWYRSDGQWQVERWVNDLEDDEPWAEERLPDWFYKA